MSYVARPAPTVPESIALYEKNAAELETRVAKVDDAAWDSKARFLVDGKVAWETSLGDMLFGFLFDAIHHRGQLSSYLRPMGAEGPVDLRSVGGRSGDVSAAGTLIQSLDLDDGRAVVVANP